METLPSGIRTALPDGERGAEYDRLALGYDLLVGNGLYNRLVWGCPVSAYRDAAQRMLSDCKQGELIDFGCGSLVFTARSYRGHGGRLTLFDRSLAMLERGKSRLPEGNFVQGDAFDPPFEPASFAAGMSWGMVHLFGAHSAYLQRLRDLIAPGGIVATSSIVLAGRRPGDRMLAALHARGEAAEPETASEVEAGFSSHFTLDHSELVGNMLFLRGRRPAR